MSKGGLFEVGDLVVPAYEGENHLCIVVEKKIPDYDTWLSSSDYIWYRIKRLDKGKFVLSYQKLDEMPHMWVRDFDLIGV